MENANNKTGQEQIGLIHKLDWAAGNLEESIKRAYYMANLMAEAYYISDNTETEKAKERVLYNHHLACVGHNIVIDYLNEAKGHIKTSAEIIDVLPTNKTREE